MISIRHATPEDFIRISEIQNLVSPERPQSAAELLEDSTNLDSKIKQQFFVALFEHEIQGFMMYTQHQDHFHPQHFWLRAAVHPDFRRLGIGTKLLKAIMQELTPFNPILLQCAAQENRDFSLKFLAHHGFSEEWRRVNMMLNLETFDAAPFTGLIEKLEAQGFLFKTIDQLHDDPDRDQKLCDLCNAISGDVPLGMPSTGLSLEQFKKSILEVSWAREAAFCVAVFDGQYVGVNNIGVDVNNNAFVDLTGVLPEYRGRGLAQALKLIGTEWALTQGIKKMFTANDLVNAPMLAVNQKFGFVHEPLQIRFGKKLLGAA
jgi:GNAT superfamily N-acetyltransferase